MQTDKKPATNKVAMSRALGAAFLTHQVEQLEKSVGRARGVTSNNWREHNVQGMRGGKRGGMSYSHGQHAQEGHKKDRKDGERREGKHAGSTREQLESSVRKESEQDADTVVVDASVLVHALGQVKKWCKDGRQEDIVIPLEALNTLDLLKKGSTPLAQRARAASRILEAQVGTNPRIRVQRDDAFVPWDDVRFDKGLPESKTSFPRSGDTPAGLAPPPEWLRRTICCCSWEVVNAAAKSMPNNPLMASSSPVPPKPSISPGSDTSTPSPIMAPLTTSQPEANVEIEPVISDPSAQKKVVLAVLAHPVAATLGTPSSLDANTFHPGRYERADGSLVRVWAQRAGIEVLDIDPSSTPSGSPLLPHHGHAAPEKRRAHAHGGADRREHREGKDGQPDRESDRKPSLVEKPIAMAIVNDQPVKVLRVLARGEKLDP